MARVELLKDVVARWSERNDYDDEDHYCDSDCDHDCECDFCRWCDCCNERWETCDCQHSYGEYCEEE